MPVQEMTQPVLRLGTEGERLELAGFELVFKSPVPGSPEGWMAADCTLPARQMGAPLHYHRKLTESFYVISGELWIRVGDQEAIAGPGSYAFVPPGTPHSFANRSDAPVRFLGHASNVAHKDFLCELFAMIRNAPVWPPSDPSAMIALGERYDSVYL